MGGFPYKNAHTLTQTFWGTEEAANSTVLSLVTGMYNMAQLPAVVDVSAMEFAFSVGQQGVSGAPVRFLDTAVSTAVFVMADGGPTGDATGAAALFDSDNWSNSLDGSLGSTGSPNQPLDAAGSSTTDLDADDWLNFRVIQNATGLVGLAIVTASYIYGKPAAIA